MMRRGEGAVSTEGGVVMGRLFMMPWRLNRWGLQWIMFYRIRLLLVLLMPMATTAVVIPIATSVAATIIQVKTMK